MKSIIRNKKFMTGAIISLAGLTVLLAALALAWFSNEGGNGDNTITFGSLKVEAKLIDEGVILQAPGQEIANQRGTIQNLGSVPALAKIKISAKVTQTHDATGAPFANPNDYVVIQNDPNITVTIQKEGGLYNRLGISPQLGFWEDGTDFYFWGEYANETYIAMYTAAPTGGNVMPFGYKITTDGRAMGNEYTGAIIELEVTWEATQLLQDGAIADYFHIADFFNVWTEYDGHYDFADVHITPFSVGIEAQVDPITTRVEEMPDCSFKDFIVDKLGL